MKFDEPAWRADLAAASPAARRAAVAWRRRVELLGYLDDAETLRCDPTHDHVPLPRCVKTRLPDPRSADLARSPWGIALQGDPDDLGPRLVYIAFGLRHPEDVGSPKPSVYALAHARI
ncbi:MAG: hypothetical protein M0T77_04675 [Actinomycetota bacterium]|nr:hypothetical protein [Actinomycetota bacterium]